MAKNNPKKTKTKQKSAAKTKTGDQRSAITNYHALAAHANALTAHALALSEHAQALRALAPPLRLDFREVLRKLLRILAELNGNPGQDVDPNQPINAAAPNVTAVLLQARIDQDILQGTKVFPISLIDLGKTATNLADAIVAFAS